MKAKYIIGIGVIVVFLIFAGINFQQSLTPYVPIAVAKEKGKTVQEKGARIEGTENYDMTKKTFNFSIKDESGEAVQVVYNGVKPSNFERAKEIVVKGRYHNGVFMADEMLVKCPSKYEAEGVEGVGGAQS